MLEIADAGNTQDVLSNAFGRLRIAARALFDHPLDHRDRESDARRLEGLQIDRREQPRLCRIAAVWRRIGKNLRQRANPFAARGFQACGRIRRLAQIAHGRETFRDVEDSVGADRHH